MRGSKRLHRVTLKANGGAVRSREKDLHSTGRLVIPDYRPSTSLIPSSKNHNALYANHLHVQILAH